MAKRISNKQAPAYAVERVAFEGSNIRGTDYSSYIIRSYETIMAQYYKGFWLINVQKYSKTTSKQMNPIFKAIRESCLDSEIIEYKRDGVYDRDAAVAAVDALTERAYIEESLGELPSTPRHSKSI